MRRPPRHRAPGRGGGDTMERRRRAVRVTEDPEFSLSDAAPARAEIELPGTRGA
ncbi:hypothetical protein [Streptomyces sp. NPDC096193]|uniref:hypothetical protein n=1 Tax=Streptomyces sp. NPDC096193 TaxID=3155821 RepID=UPI00332FF11C